MTDTEQIPLIKGGQGRSGLDLQAAAGCLLGIILVAAPWVAIFFIIKGLT